MQSVAIATLVMHVKIVNLFKWTRRGNFVEYNNDENRRGSDDSCIGEREKRKVGIIKNIRTSLHQAFL
jgi:hypothetical protein